MDKANCTIYVGQHFTLEWYYDKKGYSQAYEYFLSDAFTKKTAKLPEQEKNTCIKRREDYLQRNEEI